MRCVPPPCAIWRHSSRLLSSRPFRATTALICVYFWVQALYETAQDALAFEVFRQAINQDPAIPGTPVCGEMTIGILYEPVGDVKPRACSSSHTLLPGAC